MMDWPRIFKYSAIALVLILFLILSGWYIYLRNETATIQTDSEGRGLGESAPLPSSSLGSMFSNIVAGFRNTDDGTSAPSAENAETVSIGNKIGSFTGRIFGRTGQGVSTFSGSVKNAFGNLVSDITNNTTPPEAPAPPRLWHAHASPIAGFGFVSGATTTLRFMERSTGHLFDVNPKTGGVTRVSNTLIPKSYDAEFAPDGSVIWNTIDGERRVFSGTIATSSATGTPAALLTRELGDGIVEITPSGTARQFLSLVQDGTSAALVSSRWDGSQPRRLTTTALLGWNLHWTSNRIILAQDAASSIPGYAYEVTASGELTPLARAIPGLTVLPHTSSSATLIGSDNGNLALTVRTATSSSELSIKTVPEKCAWTSGGALLLYCAVPEQMTSRQFLDDWYRGLYHTEDSLWRVDAQTGETELFFAPFSEMNISLDVTDPRVDDRGEYFAFINALDQSLWILRISQ